MKGLVAMLMATSLLLADGCTEASQQEKVAEAECGPQVAMTGDLGVDIVGLWRWTWTGEADDGPASALLDFRPDGSATTTGHKNGPEEWSYRITDTNEVWMTGADPGDDLQSLRTAWSFDGDTWDIVDSEAYGESTLEQCTAP